MFPGGLLGERESVQSRRWCLHHLKPCGFLERNHQNSELWLVKSQKSQKTHGKTHLHRHGIDLTDRRKSWNRLETSCKAGCCGGAAPSLRDLEILIKLHKSSTSIRILELTLWLWLTLCHGFSMALYAHRNRWFTELNSMGGCSMASPVSHNFITRW